MGNNGNVTFGHASYLTNILGTGITLSATNVRATGSLSIGSSLSVASLTSNRLVLGGGTGNLTVLSAGNSGQFLMSNGSNVPVWSTVSAGGIGTTYTAYNGLHLATDPNRIGIGGTLVQATRVDLNGNNFSFYGTGNVGIGTTSPNAKLHVNGGLSVGNNVNYGTGQLNFDLSYGTKINFLDAFNKKIAIPSSNTMQIINEESGASNQYVQILSDTGSLSRIDLGSLNDTGGIITPILSVLTGTSNVGIGTTAPSQKLSVAGNAIFTGNLAINGGSINSSYGIELGSWGNNTRGTNYTGTLTANDTTLYGDYRTLSTGGGSLSTSANYRTVTGSYNDITVNTVGSTGPGGSLTRYTEGYGSQNIFNLSKGTRGIGLYNNFNFTNIQTSGYGLVNSATFSETGSSTYIGVVNGEMSNNGITSLQSSGPAMITGISTSAVMEDSFSYLYGAETSGYLVNGGSAYGNSNNLITDSGGNLRGTQNTLDAYGGTSNDIMGTENLIYGANTALNAAIRGTYNWIEARGNNSLVIGTENDISVRGIGSTVYGTKTLAYTYSDSSTQTAYGAHLDARANEAQDTAYALYLTASGVGKAFALYSETGTNYFGDNVGVGTTLTPHQLTVTGTQSNITFDRDLGTVNQSTGSTRVTSGVGSTFTTNDIGKFLVKADDTTMIIQSYVGTTAVNVDTSGSGSTSYTARLFIPNFYIGTNGKIGMGTALPREALEVKGNISANRFTDLTSYDKYYLDPAAIGDNASALSLDLYGSIRFNAEYNTNWTYIKNGPSNQIRSLANGLYFTTSNIGTAGNTITGETGLFLSASAGYVGNVGIGTTNPTYKLDVIGEIRASGTDVSSLNPGTSTNAGIYHGQNMGHLILDLNNNDANDAIAFRYSSANNTTVDTVGFVMKGNGRVGIGTTSPAAKLEVSETTTGITSILGRGNNANFNINVLQDKSSNSSGAVIGEIGLAYNTTKNSAIRFHRGSSTTGGYMTFTTNNGNQQMMIDANGNVGIGTIPSSKLHVYNNIAGNSSTDKYNLQSTLDIAGTHPTIRAFDMRVNANAASGTIANIQGNYTQMSVNSNASVTEIKNYSTWGTKVGTGTVGSWSLYDANNPSRTGGTITNLYGLKIDNLTAGTNNWSIYTGSAQSYFGGSVGIGNPNPTAPLDVAGDIKTNGYYVNQCNSANVSSAGWYRIASNGAVSAGGTGGSRAHAKFTVWDTDSGQHSASTFYASYHYGNSPTITLQSRSYYNGGLIDKVRIVEGSTYEGAAVEIYINGTVPGDVYYCMYDNVQSNGWTPVDWTAGSLPGGFTETKLDLDTYDPIMAGAANGNNNAFHIDRSGNAFFNTLDTGNGNFEINSIAAYLGNQNLRTTDSPTFNNIYANGSVRASSQLISTVANGTAPLAVSSTTVVSNLNADRLDGYHGSSSNTASTYALRNSSGDIITRLFRSEYTSTNASVNYIMTQVTPGAGTDNYLRPSTPTQVRNGMGLGTAQTPTFGGLVSNGDVTLKDKVYITDVNNRGWGSILIQGRVIQTNQHNLHLAVTNSANYVGWGVAAYDSASAPATGKLLGNGAIQILNTGSQPAATDCDSSTEWGRIQVTTGTSRGLEVCLDNGWYHIKPGNNDLAENFPTSDPTLEAGDVVKIDINLSEYVSKADKPYDQLSIGFVSTNPGQLLGSGNPGKPIALSGRVPVKVFTTENKSISHGDYITSSYLPGIASKAYKAGSVLGKALDKTTNWSSFTCPTVTSINNINWPEDAEGNNSSKPCFRVPVNSLDSQIKNSLISHGDISANTTHIYIGKIMVYIENSWQDPDISITQTGELNIDYNIDESVMLGLGYSGAKNEIETATYNLTDTLGNTVSRIAQFGEIAAAKIKTGLLSAQNIVTKNILSETSISKETKTAVISPLSDLSDTITIDADASVNGDLTIEGNTAISGHLSASDATISGTLYVDTLISREGSISEIMAGKISSLRDEIKKLISSPESSGSSTISGSSLLAESENWTMYIASESAQIDGDLSLTNNLMVGARLTVLGDTQLGNAFITGTFTAGEIAIKDNFIETTNTALYIQPSNLGSVHIMGDTLVIADNGNVTINGNLHLNGDLTAQNATVSGSLFGNLVAANDLTVQNKLTVGQARQATDSAQATPSANLALDVNGGILANKVNIATASSTIIAEGGFGQLATSSAKLATNATAGTATLPAGKTEIVIYNQSITSSSMVYLTPAGSTGNQVPYIKTKFISPTPTPESENDRSYFTIALDKPLKDDTDINWWIIN
ncbi:MAG: beta strand repeat-containing protein [Patescibacteria group bacterium]